MTNLTPKQEKELRDAFNLFDKNRSGKISKTELQQVLLSLNIKVNDKELKALHTQMDIDQNGKIDFNEFKTVLAKNYFTQFNKKELECVFKNFDTDGNGYLSLDELQMVMSKLGRHMTQNEVRAMIQSLDLNKDNRISFNEFIRLFN